MVLFDHLSGGVKNDCAHQFQTQEAIVKVHEYFRREWPRNGEASQLRNNRGLQLYDLPACSNVTFILGIDGRFPRLFGIVEECPTAGMYRIALRLEVIAGIIGCLMVAHRCERFRKRTHIMAEFTSDGHGGLEGGSG